MRICRPGLAFLNTATHTTETNHQETDSKPAIPDNPLTNRVTWNGLSSNLTPFIQSPRSSGCRSEGVRSMKKSNTFELAAIIIFSLFIFGIVLVAIFSGAEPEGIRVVSAGTNFKVTETEAPSFSVDAGGDQVVRTGEPVTFLGKVIDDVHGPFTYEWDFGDNTTASGHLLATHAYEIEGEYTAVLTITALNGSYGKASITINGEVF